MMAQPPGFEPSDDYAAFTHLTVPNAALYRAVMQAFMAAKERFTVHLRPEDVQAALPAERRPVRDVTEVLTSMCARLYGRRGAKNRAARAVAVATGEAAE